MLLLNCWTFSEKQRITVTDTENSSSFSETWLILQEPKMERANPVPALRELTVFTGKTHKAQSPSS